MAEPAEPRTLLEAMVRQRQLSWDEAAELIMRTASKREGIAISLSGRHLGRLARGERSGNRPNPVTRRAVVGDDRVTDSLSFDTRDRAQAAEMLNGIIDRAKLEPRTEYYLAVTTVEDGLVGLARLELSGVQAAKGGGAIAADYWRRGYVLDAARTLMDFGFRELKLHRISVAIGPDNAASIALADRLGMTYEGRIRDHVYTNGQWRDSLLYSILADEWAAAEPASDQRLGRFSVVSDQTGPSSW